METPKATSKHPQSKNPSSKVRVVVKVRPFLPSETFANSTTPFSCVSSFGSEHAHTNEVVVHLKDQFSSRKECYKLDSFFGEDNSVSEIFQKEVTPLISWIFHGSNATVFACGATGSGKTHLMQGSDELPGLIPLSMSRVLNMCEMSGSTAEISYYEVYMDKCYDLLDPKEREISVLDDKDGQVHLRGLSRVPVSSMSEFQQVLTLGMERRKVAHTGLNDVSSRSHGVLVISVSSPSCDVSGTVVGKLNLIDLAGNEDNGRTGNDGIRLQESAKINRSLFALSNVIYALNNNKPRVPYRESKLTRILQDSLGGNSHSLMVACLNPGEYHESVNTVSLASRSRQITNYILSAQRTETPSVKIDMEAKLNAWLESKGKTKSAKRVIAFASPLPSKTPLSITRSIKKRSACPSSIRFQGSTDKGLANARRNLFKSGAPVDSSAKISLRESCGSVASISYPEPTAYRDVEESKNCFSVTQAVGITVFNDESCGNRVTSPLKDVEDSKDCFSVAQVDDTMVSNDEICENIVTSPLKDHLIDVEESKDCFSVTQVDDTMVSNDEIRENIVTSPLKDHLIDVEESKDCSSVTQVDDTTVSNDESCENRVTSLLREHLIISGADAKDCKEDVAATGAASMPEVKVTSPAELLKNVKSSTCIPSNNSVGSPAFSGKKIRALQDSLRKVLSPIDNNSNIRSYGDLATKSPMCMVVPFDPKTPKTPNAPTCNRDEFQGTKTPLDKYNIRSSNLKSTLVQEYVEFLNSASKEELVKLKGIGQKRADHILHLRETTPLKSLSDLEMIGLSSKQVKGLFRRAARGIFD